MSGPTAGLREAIAAAGRLGVLDPRHLAATGTGFARWGPSIASLYRAAAIETPNRAAVIDHRGVLRYGDLDRRSTALARGLLRLGIEPGEELGLLCLNHRDFVEANLAAAKAGLDVVYLNPGYAPPQLAEVLDRESVTAVVCDEDLHPKVEASGFDGITVLADRRPDRDPAEHRSLWEVRRLGRRRPVALRPRISRPVLLTSGTTGVPKGARRDGDQSPVGALGLFQRIPYRRGDVFHIAAPLFHAWGLSQLAVAAALGSTVVLTRRFSPVDTVRAVIEHEATVLAAVPIMLQRILGDPACDPGAMTSLRIVASSGSALPSPLVTAWMDRVGDTLYNLYGSTEVGQASVATPDDLRRAPDTAGRVAPGSDVAVLDQDGRPLPAGSTGRIFVASGAQFTGYTGGGSKEVIDGRMSTGDVGRFDEDGLLFVTGRADDMIISGGENVFPAEIEHLLLAHPGIADAAVVGLPDPEFGQRLAAFVVAGPSGAPDGDEVRRLVGARLARHKVPRSVTFVEELPRTTTGKVLRRDLIERSSPPGGDA